MAQVLYTCRTEGAIALAAATAKSIIGIQGGTDFGVNLKKFRIGFDGVTASAVPVLVELCQATFATNAAGTNSTATTTRVVAGRANAATGFVSGAGWTAEPTVLTSVEEWLLTPNGGLVLFDVPLGDEPDSPLNNGFTLRLTAPAIVNMRATLHFSRI